MAYFKVDFKRDFALQVATVFADVDNDNWPLRGFDESDTTKKLFKQLKIVVEYVARVKCHLASVRFVGGGGVTGESGTLVADHMDQRRHLG